MARGSGSVNFSGPALCAIFALFFCGGALVVGGVGSIIGFWIYSCIYFHNQSELVSNTIELTCFVNSTNGGAGDVCSMMLLYKDPLLFTPTYTQFLEPPNGRSDSAVGFCRGFAAGTTVPCYYRNQDVAQHILLEKPTMIKANTFFGCMMPLMIITTCLLCCYLCKNTFTCRYGCMSCSNCNCCRSRRRNDINNPEFFNRTYANYDWERERAQAENDRREAAAERVADVRLELGHGGEGNSAANVALVQDENLGFQDALYDTIWTNGLEMMRIMSEEKLREGSLMYSDFETLEPFLVIGLPGIVLLNASLRSVEHGQIDAVVLHSGCTITAFRRPLVGAGSEIFWPMVEVNRAVRDCNLSFAETEYLKEYILFMGDADRIKKEAPTNTYRLQTLHGLGSRIQGIAIELTRTPRFKERFGQVVQGILERPTGPPQQQN